jgi:hypothetical protein
MSTKKAKWGTCPSVRTQFGSLAVYMDKGKPFVMYTHRAQQGKRRRQRRQGSYESMEGALRAMNQMVEEESDGRLDFCAVAASDEDGVEVNGKYAAAAETKMEHDRLREHAVRHHFALAPGLDGLVARGDGGIFDTLSKSTHESVWRAWVVTCRAHGEHKVMLAMAKDSKHHFPSAFLRAWNEAFTSVFGIGWDVSRHQPRCIRGLVVRLGEDETKRSSSGCGTSSSSVRGA